MTNENSNIKMTVESTVVLCARVAFLTTLVFFAVMYLAFLLIQPDVNPLHRFGSEYAVGRMGWLMKLAFFCWGTGLVAFSLALAKGLDREARSRIGIVLFAIAGVGIVLSGVFDSVLQVFDEGPPPRWVEPSQQTNEEQLHNLVGLIAFFSFIFATVLVSRRLSIADRLHGGYRWLRYLSWLVPAAFIAMVAVFIPYGLAGLGQRVFLAVLFLWLIIVARGLETGAFSKR